MLNRHFPALCLATIVATAGAAQANTISNFLGLYQGAAGEPGCGTAPDVSDTRNSSFSLSLNDGAIDCAMSMQGFVSAGVVGITGTVSNGPAPGANRSRIRASGSTIMSGIMVEAAAGYAEAELVELNGYVIPVQLNGRATGSLSAAGEPVTGIGIGSGAGASLTGFASISTSFQGDTRFDSAETRGSFAVDQFGTTYGDTTFGGALLPTIQLDSRGTFSVTFRLQGSATSSGFGTRLASATFNSFNSLGFSTDGPAFILPEGYTVNAPELGIIDNRWIDPRATVDPPPSPVPLPAGLPLLLAGIGGLAWVRHHG